MLKIFPEMQYIPPKKHQRIAIHLQLLQQIWEAYCKIKMVLTLIEPYKIPPLVANIPAITRVIKTTFGSIPDK